MFVDLVGSTALSRQLDPEEMREVITGFQNAVAGAVTRYDGNVAKYMGDGVLCYFGWPTAHEDDPHRSVLASLSILSSLSGQAGPNGVPLAARIGITTGVVVVGDLVGEGAAQEEAVIGETPNLAARLQTVAKPDQVVVGESTRRLLGDHFEIEDLGAFDLKGVDAPVPCFSVRRERTLEARFDARGGQVSMRMVGRDQELGLLLDRWRQASSGQGQMVLLTGEAGIGKSRIVRGLLDALHGADHLRVRYQCSPYHTDSALYPATQQISLAAGFGPDDAPSERLDKLERMLAVAEQDITETCPVIAGLLGLGEIAEARHGGLDLTPEQRRGRTLKALLRQLQGLARTSPVLFVLEDAHWIDPTTLELLERCLDDIDNMRVMMLVTARPTFQYGFGGHPNVTRLALNRLGRDQISGIVDRITGGKPLPPEILDEIAAKTDGVPLFIEELTKTILESHALRETETEWVLDGTLDTVAIPTSLHDSLMARLDRLQPVKEVAQTAACIGREFDEGLLARVSPLTKDNLSQALEQLIEAELLFRRGAPPRVTYIFKHALVRDAAYESLLKTTRQAAHARIASALEEDAKDGSLADPAILAHHCVNAGRIADAIVYLRQAGRAAMNRSAHREAIAHLSGAIQLMGELPEDPSLKRQELELQTMLAAPMIATKGYGAEETGAVFARAKSLSADINDPTLLFPVLYQQWVYSVIGSRIAEATERAAEFMRLAEDQLDPGPKLIGHRITAVSAFCRGDLDEARREFDAALALYQEEAHADLKHHYGQDPAAACLAFLSVTLQLQGLTDLATETALRAEEMARRIRHSNTFAYTLCYGPMWVAYLRDDAGWAADLTRSLLEFSRSQGLAMWTAYGEVEEGWVLAQTGSVADGLAQAVNGLEDLSVTRTRLARPVALGQLARVRLAAGEPVAALDRLREGLSFVEESGERWYEAELHRLLGEALINDDPPMAASHLEAALQIARRQGAHYLAVRAAIQLIQSAPEEEGFDKARALLAEVAADLPESFDAELLVKSARLLDVGSSHSLAGRGSSIADEAQR